MHARCAETRRDLPETRPTQVGAALDLLREAEDRGLDGIGGAGREELITALVRVLGLVQATSDACE